MNPQSAAFLEKSRQFLAKAQDLLDAHRWPDEAGRAAYLAGLHAAQAFIFESTGKTSKRHGGVQRQFAECDWSRLSSVHAPARSRRALRSNL